MKIKVKKITDNPNTFDAELENLDTLARPLQVGARAVFINSENPNEGISTSPLKSITPMPEGWIISTLNSQYSIEKVND